MGRGEDGRRLLQQGELGWVDGHSTGSRSDAVNGCVGSAGSFTSNGLFPLHHSSFRVDLHDAGLPRSELQSVLGVMVLNGCLDVFTQLLLQGSFCLTNVYTSAILAQHLRDNTLINSSSLVWPASPTLENF